MASISTDDDTLNSSIVEESIAEGIISELRGNGLVLNDDWKGYYFSSNCTNFNNVYGTFKIIKNESNPDKSKPNLVAMAGFSFRSFCASTSVIVKNLEKIKGMFNCVYVICFTDEVKDKLQTDACKSRDANITKEIGTLTEEELVDILKDKEVRKKIFKSETDLNEKLGNVVDKLIRCAGITNVHLLGKCAGGGVAIHTFTKSNIYQALYLAVPASPTNVEHLRETKGEIDISGKKIIIAWDRRDAFKFKWGKSNQELDSYEKTLKGWSTNYTVAEFNNGESDEKKYHEIPDQLFDMIAGRTIVEE